MRSRQPAKQSWPRRTWRRWVPPSAAACCMLGLTRCFALAGRWPPATLLGAPPAWSTTSHPTRAPAHRDRPSPALPVLQVLQLAIDRLGIELTPGPSGQVDLSPLVTPAPQGGLVHVWLAAGAPWHVSMQCLHMLGCGISIPLCPLQQSQFSHRRWRRCHACCGSAEHLLGAAAGAGGGQPEQAAAAAQHAVLARRGRAAGGRPAGAAAGVGG